MSLGWSSVRENCWTPLYFDGKKKVSGFDYPLNQTIDQVFCDIPMQWHPKRRLANRTCHNQCWRDPFLSVHPTWPVVNKP